MRTGSSQADDPPAVTQQAEPPAGLVGHRRVEPRTGKSVQKEARPPVRVADFPSMNVKVSVLSQPEPVEAASREEFVSRLALARGRSDEGVIVERGHLRATTPR